MSQVRIEVNGSNPLVIEGFIPSKWEDLTQDQFIDLTRLTIAQVPDDHKRMIFISKALKLSPKQVKTAIKPDVFLALNPLLDFINEPSIRDKSLLTQYKGWIGAHDVLFNFTIGQFKLAEENFFLFEQKKEIQYLDRFIGAYFYKGKQFDVDLHDENTQALKSIDPSVKSAAYLNYASLRANLSKHYQHAMPKPIPGEESKPVNPANGLLNIILNCAGVKFGSVAETQNQKLHLILYYINNNQSEE